jgi:arylsulfatase
LTIPLIPGSTTRYVSNGAAVEKLPDDFYSSKDYTDRMIDFIDLKHHDQTPFFAYLSYTAPHNPLHVPAKYIAKYRGRYDTGWDDIAQQRVTRLKELDLLAPSHTPAARPHWIKAWNDLTAEQQASRARDMEVYAAMIDYMDAQIGRLLDYLRKIGEYDNTLIVFISDNGPSRTTILDYLALGGKATEFFGQFDNSLATRGCRNLQPTSVPGGPMPRPRHCDYSKATSPKGVFRCLRSSSCRAQCGMVVRSSRS